MENKFRFYNTLSREVETVIPNEDGKIAMYTCGPTVYHFDNNAINVLRVAVYWVPALLALVFRKRLFSNSTRVENLFANMSLISAFILMIGLVQAANLFARMAAYFEIATAITLPWMIKKLFTKRSAQYVTACAAVLYFIYFLYEFGVSKGFGSGYSSITLWQFITSLFGG